MVAAAASFSQPGGGGVGIPGFAMIGALALAVTVANGNNTGVSAWTFTVVDVPPGSAIPTGIVQTGTTPTWVFTPDKPGTYVVTETVTDGIVTVSDTRTFHVPESTGQIVPGFLETSAMDNYPLNSGNNLRGWATAAENWLRTLDVPLTTLTSGPVVLSSSNGFVEFNGGAGISVTLPSASTKPIRRFYYFKNKTNQSNTITPQIGDFIDGGGALTLTGTGAYAVLATDGAHNWNIISGEANSTTGGDATGPVTSMTVVGWENKPLHSSMAAPNNLDVPQYDTGTLKWKSVAASSIVSGGVAPGSSGQIYITNGTPLAVWTSLINVELAHGRFSAGGASGEFKAALGPLTANEGSYGGLWFLGGVTPLTSANVSVYGDASGVYINTPASGGVIGFVSGGSTILAEFNWTQDRFYVGGSSSSAAMVIDWATPNETQIFAGSAQTLLTIGTVAAANIRFTGAGVTVAGIETTHGLAKFGGGGSDQAASIGPDLSTPTTRSGVFFNATGSTAPTSVYSDQNSVVIQALGGWLLQWGPGGLLQSTAGSLVIGTNVATRTVTIQAGASVPVITASTASIAFGTVSNIELVHGFATFGGSGSDYKVAFGPDPGVPTVAATLHMLAAATTPTGSNYVLLSDGNITALNAVGSTLEFQIGTGSVWWIQGSTLINWAIANFEWTEGLTPLLYSDVATTDHATHNFTIRAQYPYSLATLTNRKPANIVFDVGSPTNGGQTEGYFSFTRSTLETARIATHGTTNTQVAFWLGTTAFAADQSNAVLLSDGGSYTYLNTKALGALGLVINDASFLMYMPGQANIAFWFASTVGSAPFYFDVGGANGSVTTPFISSGNAATAFTLGTTKVGASFVIQSDAALKNISFDHPSTNVMRQSFYDHVGTSQMTLTVNDSTDFVTWALANSAYEFSWTVGSGVMDLATNFFAVGGGSAWWISASTTTVYFGGAVTATAPVIIDFTTITTPTILSGSAATSLTAGTNMIGAVFTLSADANVKGLALSKSSSTVNQIDIYSPDGTSWAQVQTHNSTGQVSLTSPSGWWDIVSNSALAELQLNATTQLFCNAANFLNWAGSHKFLRWSDSALTVTLGDTTLTNIIVGAVRGTHRDSAANFTIDTTTTDWQVRLTATQTVSLPTQTTGRWLPLILDATGVAVGTNMVITIHPPNTVKINNSTNDLVINVPGGEVQGWTVRGDSSGNWWIYPGG